MVRKPVLLLEGRRMPFAKLLLLLLLGIVVGRFVVMPHWILLGIPYLLCVMLIALLVLERWRLRVSQRIAPTLCYVFIGLLGVLVMAVHQPWNQKNYFGNATTIMLIGIIDDEPIEKEKTIRFPVKVIAVQDGGLQQRVTGKLMMTVMKDSVGVQLFSYGDKLQFPNVSRPVSPAYNPAQFDYQRYLAHKNIYRQTFLAAQEVSVLAVGKGNPVVAFALRVRESLVEKFSRYVQDEYAFQISTALIFGYRTEMRSEVLQAFTNTGTIHVLSVSGLHVSIVFGLLHVLLRFMDRWPLGRSLRFCITLVAIWSYVVLTGMAPAILRAGIMITFFVLASWTNRHQHNLNTLFASAFFILLFAPQMLMDVGFQLSYMAMLGLFTLYPLLNNTVDVQNKYLRLFLQSIFVSVAAQLFTAPLALYYFHQFPNYFLLGNLFIAIPSTLIMYVGVALACCPWSMLNIWLGKALTWLINWTFAGLQAIDGLPYAVWQGIDFGPLELVSFSLVLICLIVLWNYRNKSALFIGLGCMLLLIGASAWRTIDKRSFSGIKFYNTQREISIGVFDKGKVLLLSSLDSLQHAQLQFQVLADVQQYRSAENVQYIHLGSGSKQNREVEVLGKRIGILENAQRNPESLQNMDMIIWRYGNFTPMESVGHSFLIFDGTNSDRRLTELTEQANELGIPYYILKDNFAYVWER